jgi:hypothetical protein
LRGQGQGQQNGGGPGLDRPLDSLAILCDYYATMSITTIFICYYIYIRISNI